MLEIKCIHSVNHVTRYGTTYVGLGYTNKEGKDCGALIPDDRALLIRRDDRGYYSLKVREHAEILAMSSSIHDVINRAKHIAPKANLLLEREDGSFTDIAEGIPSDIGVYTYIYSHYGTRLIAIKILDAGKQVEPIKLFKTYREAAIYVDKTFIRLGDYKSIAYRSYNKRRFKYGPDGTEGYTATKIDLEDLKRAVVTELNQMKEQDKIA